MGFKLSTTIKGIPCPDCYYMVWSTAWSQASGTLTVSVTKYYNKAARQADESQHLDVDVVTGIAFDKSGSDKEIDVAYTYLKTLPAYAGAVDE